MTQWLRWWHGAYSDPKLHAVALRAKTSRSEVVAIWAGILEHASQQATRGDIGDPAEEIAIALALEIEVVERVISALRDKGLIVAQRIGAWEERQPQREDATATQRSKRFRAKGNDPSRTVACVAKGDATHDPPDATQNPGDATHQNRAEQSRAEDARGDSGTPAKPPGSDPALEGDDGAILWAGVDVCPPDGWARMLDELNGLVGTGLLTTFAGELCSSLTSRGIRGAPLTPGQQSTLAKVYEEHRKKINDAGRQARKRRWPDYDAVMITKHAPAVMAGLRARDPAAVDRAIQAWIGERKSAA